MNRFISKYRKIAISLLLAGVLGIAGCGTAQAPADDKSQEEAVQEEAVQEEAVQEETEVSGTQEPASEPQAAEVQAKEAPAPVPTKIAEPVPAYILMGDYYLPNFTEAIENHPELLETIENPQFEEVVVNHGMKKQVASVPVRLFGKTANEFNADTSYLKSKSDWEELYGKLREKDAERADKYLENIRSLCETYVVELSFADEDGRIYAFLDYVCTIEGDTLTCRMMDSVSSENYTISYNTAAEPLTYRFSFEDDALILERGDSRARLLPYQKWLWETKPEEPYVLIAAAASAEDVYKDAEFFETTWSGRDEKQADFAQIHFADGSITDLETTEAFFTGPNTVKYTWEYLWDKDYNKFSSPGELTIRFLNAGDVLQAELIIVDEEGRTYLYDSFYDNYLEKKE